MTDTPPAPGGTRALLARLVDAPDLVQAVRALPDDAFSAVIRRVGVEDAGELIALATREQRIAAFDEDLFVSARPGEREVFAGDRFATWLEVLLEGGDTAAASRMAELSEDFVAQALGSLVLVLDRDALAERMHRGGASARHADKALEICLSEELDGYLLVSRAHDGWDAALALALALDRDHRPFLERVLDRCAAAARPFVEDLDELATVLSAEDSLAEDVEAAREERRGRRGYVEPRAARAFLDLARRSPAGATERDPITRACLRDLDREVAPSRAGSPSAGATLRLLRRAAGAADAAGAPLLPGAGTEAPRGPDPLVAALRLLGEGARPLFEERMEELVYLSNVLLAGASGATGTDRLRPADAAEAALATVALGAELVAGQTGPAGARAHRATPEALREVLRVHPADRLFRLASGTLVERGLGDGGGFLRSRAELEDALDRLHERRARPRDTAPRGAGPRRHPRSRPR